ncbi:Rossmann-fold NAD(P)-binding domain-containing protein [Sphingobium herbicidovorans]
MITGGYGGIALAIAERLALAGGIVVLTGRDVEKGKAAANALDRSDRSPRDVLRNGRQ